MEVKAVKYRQYKLTIEVVIKSKEVKMMTEKIYDLTIIGAGPVGIYGAFYAGMHGMTTKIIDALPELPYILKSTSMIYQVIRKLKQVK